MPKGYLLQSRSQDCEAEDIPFWKFMKCKLLQLGSCELILKGNILKTIRPKEEWDTDVHDPDGLIAEIRNQRLKADLFTFAQRLPASRPAFRYHMEWDNVAAVPLLTYQHWLSKQLHQNSRNKLKKGEKAGLVVKIVAFDDELVRGIKEIQDEIPIRQGRPYLYYHKSLDWIRAGYGTYLERSTFIGAFFKGELVGFLKLVSVGEFARTMGLLTKLGHRDVAPMNALIAKAVEICAERGLRYLVYGKYDYGKIGSDSVVDFKFYNGFEHILLPRYYIPLSPFGKVALPLRVHQGAVGYLPRKWVQMLRDAKVGYYERKYRQHIAATLSGPGRTGLQERKVL